MDRTQAEPDAVRLNRASYDAVCAQWACVRGAMPVNRCAVDFEKTLPKHSRVLDIGCGAGEPIARYFAERGHAVTGIDLSERMIERAKALALPGAHFSVCDFRVFDTETRFGGVVAFDSLFHLPKEAQPGAYGRIASWMRRGARLLFTHGKADGEARGSMFGAPFAYSALDEARVRALLMESGFQIELWRIDYREQTTGTRELLAVAVKVR